jgi:cytochrome P450
MSTSTRSGPRTPDIPPAGARLASDVVACDLTSPASFTAGRRTATSDTVLGDQRVGAGDKVVIWFGAANRDPAVFADPHRLDLRRDPNPHVAFGVGPHFCLGAHLARLEASEMLRTLLAHAPDMTVGTPTRVASNFINGVAHLPARVGEPASACG